MLRNEEIGNLYYTPNDKVEEDEMGRACRTIGEECFQEIGWKARKKEISRKTKA
jgi:hypothetical protein